VITLIIATATGPALNFLRHLFRPSGPEDNTNAEAEPEPGKTDTPPPAPRMNE
jgi:hypothetical protein